MKAAATESFGYNTEQIVSSDIVGKRFGSLFDATQTMVNELPNGGCQVQVFLGMIMRTHTQARWLEQLSTSLN